jgi:hypothetical protein
MQSELTFGYWCLAILARRLGTLCNFRTSLRLHLTSETNVTERQRSSWQCFPWQWCSSWRQTAQLLKSCLQGGWLARESEAAVFLAGPFEGDCADCAAQPLVFGLCTARHRRRHLLHIRLSCRELHDEEPGPGSRRCVWQSRSCGEG